MTRTYRVRLGLVTVASLLALLVLIQPGHSQPGFPGGGIRGGGPRMPGPPAMPGRPGGIGGGFNGNIGQPPGFPQPIPQPQFPQMPQPQFPQPGVGIGGPTIYTWTCGRCGRVLGSGPVPPANAYCGVCGVNNIIPATPGVGVPGIAGRPGPFMQPPQSGPVFNPMVNPVQTVDNSGGSSKTAFGYPRNLMIAIVLGVLLLLGVGIGGVVFAIVKNQPKKPRRRRRRRLDDDY